MRSRIFSIMPRDDDGDAKHGLRGSMGVLVPRTVFDTPRYRWSCFSFTGVVDGGPSGGGGQVLSSAAKTSIFGGSPGIQGRLSSPDPGPLPSFSMPVTKYVEKKSAGFVPI